MNEIWQFQICSNKHETPLVLSKTILKLKAKFWLDQELNAQKWILVS